MTNDEAIDKMNVLAAEMRGSDDRDVQAALGMICMIIGSMCARTTVSLLVQCGPLIEQGIELARANNREGKSL